jgi:hypothetical protein
MAAMTSSAASTIASRIAFFPFLVKPFIKAVTGEARRVNGESRLNRLQRVAKMFGDDDAVSWSSTAWLTGKCACGRLP